MSPPAQSIPLCVLLAASCGVLSVVASSCVAYPIHLIKRSPDIKFSPRFLQIGRAFNIFFQLGATLASIESTFYGPISLVDPTVRASMLLTNMLFYGPSGLNIEPFTSEMRIATFQVVLGTILLPTVGPSSQDDQNLEKILMHPLSVVWLTALAITMTSCSLRLHTLTDENLLQWSENNKFALLLGAFVPAASISASCSKALALSNGAVILLTFAALGVAISFYIEIHVFFRASAVVKQSTFIPLLSGCCMVTVAVSGIVVWEEYKVISSWSGYISVMVLIVLANYQLLCSGTRSNCKELKVQEPTGLPETIEIVDPENAAQQEKSQGPRAEIIPLLSTVDEIAFYSDMEGAVSSHSETASESDSESSTGYVIEDMTRESLGSLTGTYQA